MRGIAVAVCVAVALASVGFWAQRAPSADKKEETGVLRHVVLFKFKDEATPEQVRQVEQAFAGLKGKIKEIADFEYGTDVGVENLSQGFTHCFLVTFKSTKDRDAYLPHVAHQEFVSLLKPHLDKALVVDYWSKTK